MNENKYIESYYTRTWTSGYKMKRNWQTSYFEDAVAFAKSSGLSYFEAISKFEGAQEKAVALPEYIYKFYNCKSYNIQDVFINEQLYLADTKQFNDVFDCDIANNKQAYVRKKLLEYLKNEIDEKSFNRIYSSVPNRYYHGHLFECDNGFYSVVNDLCANSSCKNMITKALKRINAEYKFIFDPNRYKNRIRVACFTTAEDEEDVICNIGMWGHYANNAEGFCVKYDIDNDDDYNGILPMLFPVIYKSKRPIANVNKINNESYLNSILMRSALTKSTDWSKENEYRIIMSVNDTRLQDNKVSFPFKREVYLGPRIKKTDKEKIINLCIEKSIKYHCLTCDEYKFKLRY